jgi:hypothetical protein
MFSLAKERGNALRQERCMQADKGQAEGIMIKLIAGCAMGGKQ